MKILLSIKPKYAEKILDGKKKYEFRRLLFKNTSIKTVVIYASSPVQKVIGEFEIEDILSLSIAHLWILTEKHSGIDKDCFDDYFVGKEIGYAIKIKKAKRYKVPLDLEKHFNGKRPPQSFSYL